MGTSTFQEDYIEYLEECNANLQEKLVKIKEFQNRILNEKSQNRKFDTSMNEITNVCNAACEAIDDLFENFTATMNSLKVVLLWKSQISQLPEKMYDILKSMSGNVNQMSASSNMGNGFPSPGNEIPDNKHGKKCGTAKVCPMIDGHVISTPRICLNRVNENFIRQSSRSLRAALSPIVEASPSTSPQNNERPVLRESRVSLQRLQLDNFRGRATVPTVQQNETSVTNGESNGFRFRKPYDSLRARYQCRLMRKKPGEEDREERNERDREIEEREEIRDNAPNNVEPERSSNRQGQNTSEEADPLEGPSWLLDVPQTTERNSSDSSSFRHNFINYKRPNYSSFSRPSNDDEMRKEVLNFNENARMSNCESVANEQIRTLTVNLNRLSEAKKLSNSANNSLNESLSASHGEGEIEGNSRSDISASNVSKRESLNCSTGNRNSLQSQSQSPVRDTPPTIKITPRIVRESFRLSCADPALKRNRNSFGHPIAKECSVVVNRDLCDNAIAKKRKNEPPVSSCAGPSNSPSSSSSNSSDNQNGNNEDRRMSSGTVNTVENPGRAKRRAAELCYQKLHNIGIQLREGSLPKSKKRSRDKKKKSQARN